MRTFIALKLPDPIRNQLAGYQKQIQVGSTVRWVAPENIHLTLRFIGEINTEQLKSVKDMLKRITADETKFRIALGELNGFPSKYRARVIWVGITDGYERVKSLMQRIDDELRRLRIGKPEAKELIPHITLGRTKVPTPISGPTLPELGFVVNAVYLIESKLTPDGPIYTDIAEYKLK